MLPREQVEFGRGKSIVDQFVLLFNTGDIEDLFEAKRDGVGILALTPAYDFLADSFTCKLLKSSQKAHG